MSDLLGDSFPFGVFSTPASDSAAARIPANPDLVYDRKQAKALLRAWRKADADALDRVRAHHPRGDHAKRSLSEAQLVIAREYGFPSWPRWKTFVEMRRLDRNAQADSLVTAICSNDVRTATTLLAADPTLSYQTLAAACACGRVATVRRMLANGDVDSATGPSQWPPLLYACYSRLLRAEPAAVPGIVAVVEWLLAAGANANAHYRDTHSDEAMLQTALFGAAGIANHAGLTRMLLAAGADVNELAVEPADDDFTGLGTEALYHACEFTDVTCLQLLLEAGPHARRVSYTIGRSIDFDNLPAVQLFLQHGADPDFRVPWNHNRTHLQKAVFNGRRTDLVHALIEAGADVNALDGDGFTALDYSLAADFDELTTLLREHGATTSGRADAAGTLQAWLLAVAARRNDVERLSQLLDHGPPLTGAPGDMPPLHEACWTGRLATVQLLLERGADVHHRNPYGGDAIGTTIHGSVYCVDPTGGPSMKLPEEAHAGDYAALIDLLVEHGATLPTATAGSDAVRDALRRHGVRDRE